MKHQFLKLLLLIFVLCFSNVVRADEIERRGVAQVRSFSESTLSLTKRGGRGTWYTGEDLNNAACYDRNGLKAYHATNYDMIGAMAMDGFEDCYKCMKITNNKDKKLSVIVKIVDKCAGCAVGKAIDLTPAAFKEVAQGGDLNLGVLDISWKPLKECPKSKLMPIKPN
ncbi:hypothetical protein BDB00DRAFT_464028 [Zychaea mexicana]|uniref:uncharacterized protein n=1 Tax=Zychaea mexicana TaxID=64656 RepID=UPI0022FE7CCE|nr:uncharacterized protein BDB00DRAFT_464028 [Zychaea mexicana]KAI9491967.1 hypothetical protein BDB00DRAFT_464028 [Zychaea mexicana]